MNYRKTLTAAFLMGMSALALAEPQTIPATAHQAGQFKTLEKALQAAGLVTVLEGAGPFTVFAPTDEAFAKLPPGTVEGLLKNQEKLKAVLTYHVVPGKHLAAEVVQGNDLKTVQGGVLNVKLSGDQAMVGPAKILTTDVQCSNGVIHIIDTVLIPK